ncbi:winged helix-turn-helix transcriptional regulator [Candidatus Woesearchaeota archaeon]|nr:winged helix-turn-helix transcriptional regulator [Candidatus Woesearchaeota archaeon]
MSNNIIKKAIVKLDKKDRKILYQLDLDARQSFSQIGKKVGLSKEVVNYRIKRLEQEGVIKGYYTIINMSRLGYMCNRFFIKFKNDDPDKEQEIITYFVKHPKYWWVDSMDGFRDLGVGSWEKTILDCHKMKEELLAKLKPYILEIEQSIYTTFQIYKRAYLINKKTKESKAINYITDETATIDETDEKILRCIAADGRMPLLDIAKKLNLTGMIVKYRIKKMIEQKIIQGFRAMIDISKIGYYWYKIEFMLKDYSKKQEMLNYFAVHPNIVYSYESTAQADLEVELEVESYEQFRSILNELRHKFKDIIESYKHLLWYKEHKIVYFPSEKIE